MRLGRLATFLLPALLACAGGTGEESTPSEDALEGKALGALVPETAPAEAVVLSNADLFAGINELHYTLLRGLFSDPALADVRVHYLGPSAFSFADIVTPVRAKDGDRLTARFSTRFASEIAAKRLVHVNAAVETNWARDFFPMVVKSASPKETVRFTYDVMEGTGPAAEKAAEGIGMKVSKSALTLEGGNIMIDEDGTLFSTTKILERNKPKSKAEVEAELRRTLGAKDIEWLDPLPGEMTAHVDIVAKVVGKKRAIVGSSDGRCPAEAPPTCAKRKPTLDKIAAAFERRGYRVTRIMNAESDGDARAMSYANSLLVNGTALLPMYFDPTVADDVAVAFDPAKVPAKAIVKACNEKNPFPGTTDLAADLVARERARCALEEVIKVAKPAGEATSYHEYALEIARRDGEARKAYESLGFRVVQVPGAGMINFGGSIHCISMQIPK